MHPAVAGRCELAIPRKRAEEHAPALFRPNRCLIRNHELRQRPHRCTSPPWPEHMAYQGDRRGQWAINSPVRLGDSSVARSLDPQHFDSPIAITSPRLSPSYRCPRYLPDSSRKKITSGGGGEAVLPSAAVDE